MTKSIPKTRKPSAKRSTPRQPASARFFGWAKSVNEKATDRHQGFLSRRPHRSFKRTYRRDYVRSLKLPGYVAFTRMVWRMLRRHAKTYGLLTVLYTVVVVALGGITSQEAFSEINSLIKESGADLFGDGIGKVGEAGLLALSAFAGGPGNLTPEQQIYLGISLLFVWLTTVWLLREHMLNRRPRLRDGLYNAGAPIISTFLIVLILLIQLLPIGIVALVYAGLTSVGILTGGFGSMLFWVFVILVSALVMYWVTSTLIALVIVTLPGMYPMRAMAAASDIVVGRRLRILYRLLWGIVNVAVLWAVIIIPVILLDTALKSWWPAIEGAPIVPYAAAFLSSLSTVWFATYVYMLYRKVVEDDAKPA